MLSPAAFDPAGGWLCHPHQVPRWWPRHDCIVLGYRVLPWRLSPCMHGVCPNTTPHLSEGLKAALSPYLLGMAPEGTQAALCWEGCLTWLALSLTRI